MIVRITILILCSISVLQAQDKIQGQITDYQNQPLAFVNIIVNEDNKNGQITDIDGLFSFQNIQVGDKLHLSYIGYQPLVYTISEKDFGQQIIISMIATSYKLEEIAVVAGMNPAHRIIKKVVANRNLNNPDKYDKYRCETYNKVRCSLITDYARYEKEVIDKRENSPTEEDIKRDSFLKANKRFQDQYYFGIIETLTDKQFIAPNSHKEVVLHNRVSGLKQPEIAALAKDLQPFSFYESQLAILSETYLNPISKGSTKIYYFDWTDTLFSGQDTIFVIEFQPKKGKTFEGLKGVLYIHSNQYAIQNIIAEPADKTQMSVLVEQKYEYYPKDKKWFPQQLNLEWLMTDYPSKYSGTRIDGKSYISKVDFQPDIRKRDFTRDKYIMADGVFDLKEEGWTQKRSDSLSIKEQKSYAFIDSISEENNLEQVMQVMNSGFNAKISFGKLDWNLDRLLSFNGYEKVRLGIGLQTNDQFIKNVYLGGYAGYGFKDKAFKYGGNIHWNISKKHKTVFKGGYLKDLKPPGTLELPRWEFPFSKVTKDLYQPVMDDVEEIYGELHTNFLKYGTIKLKYAHQTITPNVDYTYTDANITYQQFSFQELSVGLRYAYGQQTVTSMGIELPDPTKYPVFHINMTYGNWTETNTDYQKVVVGIEQKISLHRLGSLAYNIEAGWINGDVPWTKLFNSRGLGLGFQEIKIPNTFQTMEPNEYISSQFVHLFFKYHIGTLIKNNETFQPTLSIVHNQAWGKLNNQVNHSQTFKTLENGFFETGLEINNIYRINYLNIGYFGIGGGIYANHDILESRDFKSNVSYRVLGTFDF